MVHKPTRRALPLVLLTLLLLSAVVVLPAAAEEPAPQRWVPIGASYEADTLSLFAAQAADLDTDGVVMLRMLPITYGFDPYVISDRNRTKNLQLLQRRANDLLSACEFVVVAPVTCDVTIVDIQIQADAKDPAKVALLGDGVDGVYIPGGDQVLAMQVVANTPTEDALEALFARGVPIGGNSAGAAVQSFHMIAGYTGDNSPWDGLKQGAVDLWYGAPDPDQRGLRFGLQPAVVEQHVLQRGRLARLLQAVKELPASHLGVGLDNETAAVIENSQSVHSVTGFTAAAVVDQDTYAAAAGASYQSSAAVLSMRAAVLHLLPPGPYGYDLAARQPVVNGVLDADAPDLSSRAYSLTPSAANAGTLWIAGDLSGDQAGPVVQRFAQAAAAAAGPTLVLGLGAPNGNGQSLASTWKESLRRAGVPVVTSASLTPGLSAKALETLRSQVLAAGAIMVVSDRQDVVASLVPELAATGLVERWASGAPVLLDNGAAAAAGTWMSAERQPTAGDLEDQGSETFLLSGGYVVDVAPGLGLVPGFAFEPRALYDYRWGWLASQVYHHPHTIAVGVDEALALEVTPAGATVIGADGVVVLDGRYARVLAAGSNDAIAATWLLVDTFAPGEVVAVP